MMARILFLVPSDYEDLRRKGVDSMLREREAEGDFERVITVHPAASLSRVIDLTPKHRLIEIAEAYLPFCRTLKFLRYPHHAWHLGRLLFVLIRLIDAERINMIRAQDPAFTGLLAWLITRLRPIPFAISIHADYEKRHELDPAQGAPTVFGLRGFAQSLERFTLRRADLVLPIRPSLAEKIRSSGVSAERIRITPHGINLEPYRGSVHPDPRPALNAAPGVPILSFVGRLTRENYVTHLVDLAGRLKNSGKQFLLVMVGDGPEKTALDELIQRDGLMGHVRMLGFQPQDFVLALRSHSAISLCLMGGFSLIEACAAGSPVIAYDVEWHAELVQNGKTGWLIPEGRLDLLTDAVKQALEHPDEAKSMGQNARQLAFSKHDLKDAQAQKLRCYQEMLSMFTAKSA